MGRSEDAVKNSKHQVADITGNVPQDVKCLAGATPASRTASEHDNAFGVGEALKIAEMEARPNLRQTDKPEVCRPRVCSAEKGRRWARSGVLITVGTERS